MCMMDIRLLILETFILCICFDERKKAKYIHIPACTCLEWWWYLENGAKRSTTISKSTLNSGESCLPRVLQQISNKLSFPNTSYGLEKASYVPTFMWASKSLLSPTTVPQPTDQPTDAHGGRRRSRNRYPALIRQITFSSSCFCSFQFRNPLPRVSGFPLVAVVVVVDSDVSYAICSAVLPGELYIAEEKLRFESGYHVDVNDYVYK